MLVGRKATMSQAHSCGVRQQSFRALSPAVKICGMVVILVTLTSCRTPNSAKGSMVKEQATSTTQDADLSASSTSNSEDANEFRAIFHEALGGTWERRHLDRAIYLPTADLMQTPNSDSVDDFLETISQSHQQVTATDLYREAQRSSLPTVATSEQALRNHPVTIVIVPGVFGEFIETKPMDEVVSLGRSSYAQEVRQKLAAATPEELADERFDLQQNDKKAAGLDELFLAASLDDDSGRPLVRVIEFAMPFKALESLGDNREVAAIYIRRLTKLFNIVGTPENIFFLGYSRGTPLGLQMIADAKDQSWMSKVRGMIALGGVIYGSDLADEIDVEGTKINMQISAIETLKNKLREAKGSVLNRGKIVRANTAAWLKFARTMVQSDPEMDLDAIKDIRGGDPRAPGRLLVGAWKTFGLSRAVTQYNKNIRKFKTFATQLLTAVNQLKTSERIRWWKTHQLPTNGVRYYAIAATMADPDREAMGADEAQNTVAYDADSNDYKMLLQNHRDFGTASGHWLNDSQVAVHKARFWPRLGPLLNPEQQEMDTVFLGVLGTHHWGLALKTVNEMLDGGHNPFRRKELLQALAMKAALDLSRR